MKTLLDKIKQAGLNYADVQEYIQKSNNKHEAHCQLCRALEALKNANLKIKFVFPLALWFTGHHFLLGHNETLKTILEWMDLTNNHSI